MNHMWNVVLLYFGKVSEKLSLFPRITVPSAMGIYKIISEVRSAESLLDKRAAETTDRHVRWD
jgi:hypothetical protein